MKQEISEQQRKSSIVTACRDRLPAARFAGRGVAGPDRAEQDGAAPSGCGSQFGDHQRAELLRDQRGRAGLANPNGATKVIHNYESVPGAIPIPATLSLELGRVIGAQQENITYRFVSDFPFQNRAPHQLDAFEKEALEALRADPEKRSSRPIPRSSTTRCA